MKKAAFLLVLVPATADAGGPSRPFNGSARASGMGGAFAAIADDASCVTANPAGCAFNDPSALVSLDLVYAPRSYVPLESDGSMGPAEDAAAVAPAPTLGVLFRPGADSHVILGVGAWNSYGGTISWEKNGLSRVDSTTDLVFETGLLASWAVDDHVALGAVLRVGLGLFAVEATDYPIDGTVADVSATGVGVGAGLGLLVRASDRLAFGLSWKSSMDITTTGSGTFQPSGQQEMDVKVEHVQNWPQSLSVATAYRGSDALTLAAQIDWTGWSRFESLDIAFPGGPPTQHFVLDWDDAVTVRAGAQYATSPTMAFRGGLVFDSNSVPDRTIERQYLDGPKFGLSAGASFGLSRRLALDVAADAVAGPTRSIPDNSDDVPAIWDEQINNAPGEHSGQVFTLSTALRIVL